MATSKRREKHHHKHDDDDHKKHKKPPKKPPKPPGTPPPGSVTESLKGKSTQSGDDAMNATPESYPAEPANAEAVYTTGPGQAVEYNYTRQGTYSEDYAQQQSQAYAPVPPIAGSGQVLTQQSAGGTQAQAAWNNPT